jgi:hypothetical protein
VGIELVTVEARVVIASIETYLNYAPSLSEISAAREESPEHPHAGARSRVSAA